jgi:Mn2+/Fe2+ NRAMP family transporter
VRKMKTIPETGKGLLSRLGPGLITGASDDDPSGIGTYSQAGAQLGFGIGWTMLLTYPLMAAIQEISARIGRVTGHGIAGNVRRNFPAPVIWSLVLLLFVANTINVAADLGAMADSLEPRRHQRRPRLSGIDGPSGQRSGRRCWPGLRSRLEYAPSVETC